MQQNLILAGVGGQGILTIAQAISIAALKRGWHIKQAEVHGMSQRGGGVQSHLRLSDSEVFSDLVPVGHADLIIAVEPLECLRYIQYLRRSGSIVSSLNPFVNIGNYPPVEGVLYRIAQQPRHTLIDAERLGRAAGSGRSANMAMLGAASIYLEIEPNELDSAVAELFAAKGERVVDVNRRAFQFGRNAARAYRDGLERGGTSSAVRHWIETLPPEHLARPEAPDAPIFDVVTVQDRLSGAEAHALERTLVEVYWSGRRQLFEHEVYQIVQLVGAITPPHHLFVTTEELISEEALAQFPGDRVVLKIVSPDIVHKTDIKGIRFVRKNYETVRNEIDRLIAAHRDTAEIHGVLVVEHVAREQAGFGNELFVGIRATREFGPVVAAGLGGVDTEYLATKMKPGIAVAKALATDTTAEQFLELFKRTAAYDLLSGRVRGHRRIVSDGELLRCFRAFILIAQRFCVDRGEEGPDVAELEVNPFAFKHQQMIPLDGHGQLAPATQEPPARPIEKIKFLVEPKSIGVIGVSSTAMNFGRIILNNLLACEFPRDHLYVIKDGVDEVDGVQCVPSISALPERLDLLVIATGAKHLPAVIRESVDSENVQTGIMITGGVGETEGSEELVEQVKEAIAKGRERPDGGPVFLGPNSLGVVSRIGHYDTFFIPNDKMDKRWSAPPRPLALISQSGAFIISRLSKFDTLDPALAVSIGNQIDLTPSDVLRAVGDRDDIRAIGIYAEGFNDLDGLALLRAIGEVTEAGKDVIFYKAGRTQVGRDAAAGHTASVAGDYDICHAAANHAGALVADTFREFEQLVELATALHEKQVGGIRIGAISNAGFETVGMADAIQGQRYTVEMAPLSVESTAQLASVLGEHGLGRLVNPRNPLDLTPMAPEAVYEGATRVMLESDDVDAVVVAIIPLTAQLKTTDEELEESGSLADLLPELFASTEKPLVVVIDSGSMYDRMARKLRLAGIPVFRSADEAIRSLGRYLVHRQQIRQ